MPVFILWLLLVLGSTAAAYAPPYPIIDSTERSSLGLFLAWYEDPTGQMTIEEVAALPSSAFRVSERDTLHFGFTRSTYWFRVALQNTRDSDEVLLLEVPHPSLSHVDFHRPVGDGFATTYSGSSTQRVVGDFDHQSYLFGVSVASGATEVLWFRVESDLALDFSLNSEMPESFTHAQSVTQIVLGVALGLLVSLVLFNLVALATSGQTVHAWYALFLLAAIVFLLARLGYLGVLFFRGPGVQVALETAAALVATAAALQFCREFLRTAEFQRTLDAWLGRLVAAGAISLLVLPFLDRWHYGPLYTTFAVLAMPLTLVAAGVAIRLGCPDAPRYLAARLFAATAGGLAVGNDLGLLDTPLATVDLLIAGACIEAAMLAWALQLRQARTLQERADEHLALATGEAATRARTEFLARFSHDIRTPLNGILGMTELLSDTSLTPRQREYMLTIRGSGENLLEQLNEALDWSRLESGQLEIQRVDFDLPQLVADAVESVQLRAEEKHIEVVVDIDPDLPARVNGDPARLRQVLCNLLGNAVRYTHRGEVQVRVLADTAPHTVRIEVRDTGVGIARERLAGLLERSNAAQESRGFGLVIARQLIERMGGHLGVQSEEHRGSLFWLSLPLPASPDQSQPDGAEQLKGKRLLVVDDNAAVRRVIETQAASWGMHAAAAENGQDALAIARTQANLGTPFDIVVVDHNMPGMSGLQLAARIKEDPLIRHDAIIVMLTGLNIAPTDTMARNVGIRRVLTKPVAGRALQAVLAEELLRRERFEPEAPGGNNGLPASMRVLVVEDHTLSQKVIRGMLAKLGVRSDVVSNGQEAVEAVQHHHYDLVLMDCEMPVLDGYEATRRIRAWEIDNARRQVPIIALSAHILNEIKERCRQAGMNGHMAKPVDLNELRETLRIYAVR